MRTIGYTVQFQTETTYKSIKYGQGTIYSSACGPSSLCNVLTALGIASVSIPTMCTLAVSCGARVDGGTLMAPLLKAAGKKYGFVYRTTSKNMELLAHLKAGGAAILHAGDSYPLFSSSGHFVAAVAASGETITILDSYWYSGKYTATALRRNYTSVISNGIVKTSLTQCGKATIDRSPSYYLISKQEMIEDDTERNTKEDTMVYYEKLNDIPAAYQKAVQLLLTQGALKGTDDGLHLSDDTCRVLTMLQRAGVIQPIYAKREDIPSYYADAVGKLLDNGAIQGTGESLALTEELCRVATILDRMGIIKE